MNAKEFREAFGVLGDTELRTVAVPDMRRAGQPSRDRVGLQGHAAVFGSPSIELRSPMGSFIEYIDHGAFDDVLSRKPEVLLTWDHDSRYTLARTGNGTLNLHVDSRGLKFFASCARTSYTNDIEALMADGTLSQASFLFQVAPDGEDWDMRGDQVTRTITRVGELFDVCVCASGAYTATDSSLARSAFLAYGQEHIKRAAANADARTAILRARAAIQTR